jgi:hypothetical protein
MKKKLSVIAALVASAGMAQGVTYTVTNNLGLNASAVTTSTGVRLTGNGANSTQIGYAAFGVFTSDEDVLAATTGAQLNTAFTSFGSNGGLFNNPATPTNFEGLFSRQGTLSGANLTEFTGENVYLIITNGTSITNGTEFLVFKFDATYIGTGTDTGQTITLNFDTTDSAGTLLIGNIGPSITVGGLDTSSEASFQLAAIPEPSAALLGMLGALGLLRRRR